VTIAPSIVALIPARAGSKRVPGKNVRRLGDHPALAYTIAAARGSGIFTDVIVSTDDERYADIAKHYGASVPFMRPAEFAGDGSPDIDWVEHSLATLKSHGRAYDCFSLLRPTSPFRLPTTIQRAWSEFRAEAGVDSLRAVERCRQHPGKMWIVDGARMTPLLPGGPADQPWHSSQTQTLPVVHVQNASLEIARARVVFDGRTIAGTVLMPFLTSGFEGFDVNTAEDWILAEHFLKTGDAVLPTVSQSPYPIA
jgi:CMP-N,N'-diacetyllegionaminic acid synthase